MLEPDSRENGIVAADGWERMHSLCAQEADALEQALRRLAEHWPLTQPAAVAFQEWGAHLVKAMRGTAHAAAANGPALDAITYDIDLVRSKVAGLMAEAQEFQRAQDQYGAAATNRAFHERYIGGEPPPEPLALPWQVGLDLVARHLMADLEASIDINAARFVIDDPYRAPQAGYREPDETWAPYVETAAQDPAVRPVADKALPSSITLLDSALAESAVAPSGLAASSVASSAVDAWPTAGSFVDTPVGRVLAPGGVIGPPAVGASVPASRNLPGAGRPAGPGLMPMAPPMMASQASGADSPSPRRARRGLRSVFEVPEGPPAVLMPPEEPRSHHPEPGVIGIDQ